MVVPNVSITPFSRSTPAQSAVGIHPILTRPLLSSRVVATGACLLLNVVALAAASTARRVGLVTTLTCSQVSGSKLRGCTFLLDDF